MAKTADCSSLAVPVSWLLSQRCEQLLAALHIVAFTSIVENSEVASSCCGTNQKAISQHYPVAANSSIPTSKCLSVLFCIENSGLVRYIFSDLTLAFKNKEKSSNLVLIFGTNLLWSKTFNSVTDFSMTSKGFLSKWML